MNRLSRFVLGAFPLFLGASIAHALIVKPNVAPVVNGPIGDRQQYSAAIAIIDVAPFFRDPDASSAALLVTPLGSMKFTLDGETAPITVANFLNYQNTGRYFNIDPTNQQPVSTFFHRSVTNFVIQAGGFLGTVNPNGSGNAQPTQVLTFPPIQNEPVISNRRGTIAMAKTSQPNSATSQWFINLSSNVELDDPNIASNTGGFTVFGRVAGTGMAVADAIAALPKVNVGSPFESLPLRNYTSPNPIRIPNLVSIPETYIISPFVFSATSNNPSVATVSTSGTNVLVTGNQTGSAQITVTATDLDGAAIAQNFNVNVVSSPGRLRNISTRVNFPTGNEVLIGGFIVGAGPAKRLAVRAIGPSLGGPGGLPNALNNPTLEFRNASQALLASNDNWASGPDHQLLTDLGIAPTAANESALIVTIPASATNRSFTGIVRSNGNTPGVCVMEVYDLDSNTGSTLLNLSGRGTVGTGGNVMIGGFITGGVDSRRLIVRAIGPSLAGSGVTGALPDPTLELHNAQGALVDSNNDWQSNPATATELQNLGVAPTDPRESALISTLAPGRYTAIVAGTGNQPTGVALVEIYQAP